MKIANQHVSWSNYLSPTPKNLQVFVETVQGGLAVAAGSTFFMGDQTIAFYLLIGGYVLDKLSKFFGRVANDMEKVTVSGDHLTVTTETIEAPKA